MSSLTENLQKLVEEGDKKLSLISNELDKEKWQRERLKVLSNYQGDDRMVSSIELSAELKTKEQPLSFSLGLPAIDGVMKGIRPGDLVIVAGATGCGKTTFCQFITLEFLRQGCLSGWFSFEVSQDELLEKFERMNEAEVPFFYLPHANLGNTVEWIEERIFEAKVAKHPDEPVHAVFIDHLHRVLDRKALAKGNTSFQIGETAAALKQMALKLNVVVFLMAHITKLRPEEMPDYSFIRDSSMIAAEADSVIMLYRHGRKSPNGYIQETELSVALQKNRRGGVGESCRLDFIGGRYQVVNYVD